MREEGKGRREARTEGNEMLTLMHRTKIEQGRRLAKAGPAAIVSFSVDQRKLPLRLAIFSSRNGRVAMFPSREAVYVLFHPSIVSLLQPADGFCSTLISPGDVDASA